MNRLKQWWDDHGLTTRRQARNMAGAAEWRGVQRGEAQAETRLKDELAQMERRVLELAKIQYRRERDGDRGERLRIMVEISDLMLMGRDINGSRDMMADMIARTVRRELRDKHVLQRCHDQERDDYRPMPPYRNQP